MSKIYHWGHIFKSLFIWKALLPLDLFNQAVDTCNHVAPAVLFLKDQYTLKINLNATLWGSEAPLFGKYEFHHVHALIRRIVDLNQYQGN